MRGVPTLPEDWTQWRDQVDLAGYDDRWQAIAAAGGNPHGEADLVAGYRPGSVLDAGCGTGRVAVELARRGIEVLGVDADADMVAAARAKAPDLTWLVADLARLALDRAFDLVVLAGNVVPYVAAEDRAGAVANCARHLRPGGHLVAGFVLREGWPTVEDYDGWCAAAGLRPVDRFATWERGPWNGGDYAVSVHRRD